MQRCFAIFVSTYKFDLAERMDALWLHTSHSQWLKRRKHYGSTLLKYFFQEDFPMHIWLDPALYQQENLSQSTFSVKGGRYDSDCSDDCVNDCDCSCYLHGIIVSPYTSQERVLSVWNHELRCSQDLYLEQCDDAHWLVCNPVRQGSVAVLDEEAHALLEIFRGGYSLQNLTEPWVNVGEHEGDLQPLLSKAQLVMLFITLGLVIDTCQADKGGTVSLLGEPSTLSAWLHMTNACNMSCSYCYIAKSTEHMSEDVGTRSVDAVLRSAIRYGYQKVRLKYAGGEALLRLPQILILHDYAVQQAEQHGLQVSATMLSNGAALTPRAIQQLQKRNISVMISIDGIGAAHDSQRPLLNGKGSSHLVQRAIMRLLENNLVPHINVTISHRNLSGLVDLVAYLLKHDLPFSFSYYRENDCSATFSDLQFSEKQMIAGMKVAFAYIQDHLTPRKIYVSLLDKASLAAPHHHTCGAGRDYLVIDQHGGVAKCQVEIAQTITTIEADNPLQEIRAYQEGTQVLDVDSKEGCRTCNWRYWCGGGCAVLTHRLTGRNDIRSPNCGIYKALFPEALRLEALRLLKYTSPL
jgi:uncharacterized protein